jgi:hypothetical protein
MDPLQRVKVIGGPAIGRQLKDPEPDSTHKIWALGFFLSGRLDVNSCKVRTSPSAIGAPTCCCFSGLHHHILNKNPISFFISICGKHQV